MTTLKGIFPNPNPVRKKNYLHENLKNLRKLERDNYEKKLEGLGEEDEKQRRLGSRMSLNFAGQRSADRIEKTDRKQRLESIGRKTSAPAGLKSNKIQQKPLLRSRTGGEMILKQGRMLKTDATRSTNNLDLEIVGKVDQNEVITNLEPKVRSLGIQTLNVQTEDELYLEGTIRYPSSRAETRKPTEIEIKSKTPDENKKSNVEEGGAEKVHTGKASENKDFVKLNKEKLSVASRLAHQLMNGSVPPNYRKGVVPKYILERKEELQQKAEKDKADAEDACPPGHVALPDHERKETLRLLKTKHQDLVNELNKLPIRSDTLRCQTRKIEIEKQLAKLEDGIKIFSRPKVFVKIDS